MRSSLNILPRHLRLTISLFRRIYSRKMIKVNCLYLGVFDKNTVKHIGSIKYELICFDLKEVVMGVLLDDPSWWGKNVFNKIFFLVKNHCQTNTLLV